MTSLKKAASLTLGLIKDRVPGQLIIQFTNHCNASCPQCGMNVNMPLPRTRLDDAEVFGLIDAAATKGVEVLSFTGGEPLLFWDRLQKYIAHAGRAGIKYIRTGTNGFPFARPDRKGFLDKVKKLADEMAETPLRNFWISLDSAVPEVHEKMRGLPGVVSGLARALPVFHERGIFPSANLGLNRNLGGDDHPVLHRVLPENDPEGPAFFGRAYEQALEAFYRLVIRLGFTMVNSCYPMSLDEPGPGQERSAVYAATSPDRVVRFSRSEKIALFSALFNVVPRFRSEVRIFSPLCSLKALIKDYQAEAGAGAVESRPCRGGVDFFFVDSDSGRAFPCGYRGGEDLGRFQDLDLKHRPAPFCRRCDWECFRDPSELFGPAADFFQSPAALIRRWAADPTMLRLWLGDLFYYRACGFFDGRKAPVFRALRAFDSKRADKVRLSAREVKTA